MKSTTPKTEDKKPGKQILVSVRIPRPANLIGREACTHLQLSKEVFKIVDCKELFNKSSTCLRKVGKRNRSVVLKKNK